MDVLRDCTMRLLRKRPGYREPHGLELTSINHEGHTDSDKRDYLKFPHRVHSAA